MLSTARGGLVVEMTSVPVRGADGAVVCCRSVLTDITARKSSELRWRLLSETTDALVSTRDYASSLAAVARLLVPELADVAFIDLREAGGAVIRHAAHFAHTVSDGAQTPQARVFASGEPMILAPCDGETIARALAADGRAHLGCPGGSLLLVPLLARERPAPERTLGVVTCVNAGSARRYSLDDLTLAQQVAARIASAIGQARELSAAQQAIRARDDLSAILSHDLRSPLEGIRLQCEQLLAAPTALSPGAARGVESIQRGVRMMERLIGDVLDASRIDGGQLRLRLAPCAAASLVAEATRLARPLALRREIALEVAIGAPAAQLRCDRDRILQVLDNVLGNAIKFTAPHGTVTLTVSTDAEQVAFVVRDTGEGIAAAHLPHVFDRYWRAQSADASGVGLGLYIAKAIVEAHRGQISVASQEGRGTTVRFTLPGLS
jgi:signal transduction histidine kinase